ncbi:hypothetical protein ABL78_3582 [Leptomonas seymouri]|uniref:RRM domain-containing protein n=1 Tax=Leptomonas seymouri TaxID=5684 RepID=A0A0N1PC24_LEPSE|nr:hypothetical protein ABL78_3582 [Leptomonas seymouri]|eukprot:KPI87341.1 hypothetical protein ABL78_3582 [Leptomonas seymouri]
MMIPENHTADLYDITFPALLNGVAAATAAGKASNRSHSIAHPSASTTRQHHFSKDSRAMSAACVAPADLMALQTSRGTCSDGENNSRIPSAPRSSDAIPASTAARRGPNLVYWLRGLPFQAQRSDVEAFLAGIDYSKLEIGVLESGECSGNAFVELKGSKHQAELEALHNAFIPVSAHAALAAEVRPKPRFVEVMPSNPAKRLEQLEHDRCLPRDATRRQRRLQNGLDIVEVEPFNPQFNSPFPNGSLPAFVNVSSNSSSQFSSVSISGKVPMQVQPPQQTCYVPYGVPVASSSMPAHFIPTFSNYAPPTNVPTMISIAPQLIGDVASTAAPQAYSLSYDYVGAIHPTAYLGQPIAFQQPPQQQPQQPLPTVMFASPYRAASFTLPPSYR